MAIPAYMKIDGIPGSVNVSGREGFVEVLEFNHRVYVPTDRDYGSLTGTRKHDSLVLHMATTNRLHFCTKRFAQGKQCRTSSFGGIKAVCAPGRSYHSL